MLFAEFLLLGILTMKLFPHVPVSRLMHRALVEAPLRRVTAMNRRHLIFGLILLTMLFAVSELIMLLGSADLAILMAWDVSIYVDALLAMWTLAAVTRGKLAAQALAAVVAGPLRAARWRASRHRRSRTHKGAANDPDDDGGIWVNACTA